MPFALLLLGTLLMSVLECGFLAGLASAHTPIVILSRDDMGRGGLAARACAAGWESRRVLLVPFFGIFPVVGHAPLGRARACPGRRRVAGRLPPGRPPSARAYGWDRGARASCALRAGCLRRRGWRGRARGGGQCVRMAPWTRPSRLVLSRRAESDHCGKSPRERLLRRRRVAPTVRGAGRDYDIPLTAEGQEADSAPASSCERVPVPSITSYLPGYPHHRRDDPGKGSQARIPGGRARRHPGPAGTGLRQ